jgi:hypothetical protein
MKLFRCSESEPSELSTLEHIRIVNVDATSIDCGWEHAWDWQCVQCSSPPDTNWIDELINELDQLAVGETSTRKHGPVDFTRVR